MAVITFGETMKVAAMSWQQQRMAIAMKAPFGQQTIEASPPVWIVSIKAAPMRESLAGAWKALLLQLRGSTNQLALWDKSRPAPRGTLRGELMFGADVAQGDVTLTIRGGYDAAGKTLLQGDLLGFGSGLTQQVVMAVADVEIDPETRSLFLDFENQAYSSGYVGEFSVTVEPPARNAIAAGAAVTWDKPKALFRVQTNLLGWDYESAFASGFALDLQEDWRP